MCQISTQAGPGLKLEPVHVGPPFSYDSTVCFVSSSSSSTTKYVSEVFCPPEGVTFTGSNFHIFIITGTLRSTSKTPASNFHDLLSQMMTGSLMTHFFFLLVPQTVKPQVIYFENPV